MSGSEYNDHVICTECCTEQVVELGSETCLKCGFSNGLMWANSNVQEVSEDPHIIGKWKEDIK